MADDAIEAVRLRYTFYRDNYRRLAKFLILMVLANIILSLALSWVISHPRAPEYFATTADGRVIKLNPLSQPVYSMPAVLNWASEAAIRVYTYDFVDYRSQLQTASEYFTAEGWRNFQKALVASRNLKTVLDKKLVSTAVPTGAPVVLSRGVINDRYAWKIQVPVLVTYESASTKIKQPLLVTMVVIRTSILTDPKGIAIAQFVAASQ